MKAKFAPRIRLENRPKLQDFIPLDTPFHVFVDPSAACNFRCKYCFDRKKGYHDIMKFDLFKKVIEDFKKFPQKLKVVRMYGFGEPLLNPNFPAMVAYAKKSGVCESTDTTSNGSRLNPWLNRQIVAAGLDAINISVPAMTSEKILESTGAKIDFDAYVANIADLYDHKEQLRINLKIINYTFTDDEKQFFYDTFGDICDEIGIENAIPQWDGQTEAGFNATNPDINVYYLPIIPAIVCPWIFYMSVIHANGDICACFGDWHHDNLMGNIKTDSFFDVWNGELRKQLLIDHLTLHRDRHPLCDRCHITTLCQPDIIDPYREEILARFL
jgi:radical SAM protein with 4Fe4S-binding SPASM domain